MHVLVTGCCGFIGSHLVEALLRRGDTVTGIDNFNDFYDPAIKEAHRALLEAHNGFSLVRKIFNYGIDQDGSTPVGWSGVVDIASDGIVDALGLWFESDLTPRVKLRSGPGGAP